MFFSIYMGHPLVETGSTLYFVFLYADIYCQTSFPPCQSPTGENDSKWLSQLRKIKTQQNKKPGANRTTAYRLAIGVQPVKEKNVVAKVAPRK